MNHVFSVDTPVYHVNSITTQEEDDIIAKALSILHRRVLSGPVLDDPCKVKDYLKHYLAVRTGVREREIVTVIFLNSLNAVIDCQDMFLGTIDKANVHPREILREAIRLNAAAVILSHNHPSGTLTPSSADIALTKNVKEIMGLVDVIVLDHIITGGGRFLSMRETGDFYL